MNPNDLNPALAKPMADALRMLAADAVEHAKSGHPGMPMGMADIALALWHGHLQHDPADPQWPDRDRFVLSNGHGAILLYALLHLTGYELPLEELKAFRRFGSRTPGHPERGHTPGVETTTGPLGQGLANAVGLALAERLLAHEFNRDGHTVVDHHTYAFVGDGCLMEGISHEACSLAGTWGLNKLVVFYDDNGISIDGHVADWFSDDTAARFRAYGWQVIGPIDGHDASAVSRAITEAKAHPAKTHHAGPTLIVCRTTIGQGAPNKAGGHECHGAPLGAAEVAATRKALGWPHPPFDVPAALREAWDARSRGAAAHAQWQARFDAYAVVFPELAAEFQRRMRGELPESLLAAWPQLLEAAGAQTAAQATRQSSQQVLNQIAHHLPELLGGSADLAPSNLTQWAGCESVRRHGHGALRGNYLHYGVREFGMAAIVNGLALHGGLRPYGGTFLMFSEYARNALRMAALMGLPAIHVFTHDSIGLGEDGPTHQPVEQLATLRLIPHFDCWRPCDAAETVVAWQAALQSHELPTALVLSRQALPQQRRGREALAAIERGGYVLRREASPLAVLLIATGSEVQLAMQAAERLEGEGVGVRVVSMPCVSVFERQGGDYRAEVLPAGPLVRIAIEAGRGEGWWRFVGREDHGGAVIGVETFGASADAARLFEHFGLTADKVVERARNLLGCVPA
jgi:transketolase